MWPRYRSRAAVEQPLALLAVARLAARRSSASRTRVDELGRRLLGERDHDQLDRPSPCPSRAGSTTRSTSTVVLPVPAAGLDAEVRVEVAGDPLARGLVDAAGAHGMLLISVGERREPLVARLALGVAAARAAGRSR